MYEVETEELDYLTHDGVALRARIYRPVGDGPFPALVDLHGGAWVKGVYSSNDPIDRPLAAGGVVVMAADYSLPPAGRYPTSVQDANYAVRWLKMNAERHGSRPDLVGAMGTSAGGHLAVLSALKPRDPRYAALPLPGGEAFDASVSQVVLMWPVICPLQFYRENEARKAAGDTSEINRNEVAHGMIRYWDSVENMEEASPMLAAERGDAMERPEILYVMGVNDMQHGPHNMQRFVEPYRAAGGHIEAEMFDAEPFDLLRQFPEHGASKQAVRRVIDFAHGQRVRVKAAAGA